MDGEDDLYDEFGNYVGPELGSDEDEDLEEKRFEEDSDDDDDLFGFEEEAALVVRGDGPPGTVQEDNSNAIVLHEDKQYYPDAEDVYPGVETVVMDEDAMLIQEPICKPIKVKNFSVLERNVPDLKCSTEYATILTEEPNLIRHVCVAGHYEHGKTSFLDILVQSTHVNTWPLDANMRYTDTRKDEQERGLSIKSAPVSLVLPDHREKSYMINVIDTPGHVDFADEISAGMRISDGLVVVVDAIEGVMLNTQRVLRAAAKESLPVCVVMTKMDRLIVELKLPPEDAYFKIRHTLTEINRLLKLYGSKTRVSPSRGNVCFSSGVHMWTFTLESMARLYAKRNPKINVDAFSKRLWGDVYYNEKTRTFSKKKINKSTRTFVQFCLDPVYKLYAQVLGEESLILSATLKRLGIKLKQEELHLDPKPLLRLVMRKFFESQHVSGFTDMIVKHVPSPKQAMESKIVSTYSGYTSSADGDTSNLVKSMIRCDANGPLMINAVKSYSTPDGESFVVLGRIMSGTIKIGQRVRVLGEAYTPEDREDSVESTIQSVSLSHGRHQTNVNQLTAGNWCLLEGVDESMIKTATITSIPRSENEAAEVCIFRPIDYDTISTVKLAIEPLRPSELPKMLEALRKVNRSYPLLRTKVEESGEHVIFGTGEMYMDCVMHDLRRMYSEIEIKVSDPVVGFKETVSETSSLKCYAETPNKKNKITMIAEPLDKGIAEDIESGHVEMSWSSKRRAQYFQSKYDWDVLAARNIWSFGPELQGPNVLIDDTLSAEVNKKLLRTVRSHITQGFQWGCREGPLCEEPIRNVKFNVMDAEIAEMPIHRGGAQIIPTSRRVLYSSFLTATPRLMEPVYYCEVIAPHDTINAVYNVLSRRRGHVTQDAPLPGSPFYTLQAYIPVIDSFGFETDLRVHTQGLASVQKTFDHWAVVPGDPLDKSVVLRVLEPSPLQSLAREFCIKTRRRKGLSEDVSMSKFFDESMLLELAREDMDVAGKEGDDDDEALF